MNTNDLNNMAKRYKDEMMKLYQKSGRSSNGTNATGVNGSSMNASRMTTNGTNGMNANGMNANGMSGGSMNMANTQRDVYATPTGTPGASYYSTDSHTDNVSAGGMQPCMQGGSFPVRCSCHFPSAESIINGTADNPMILPATEEHGGPVYNTGYVQPRMNAMYGRNAGTGADVLNGTNGTNGANGASAGTPTSEIIGNLINQATGGNNENLTTRGIYLGTIPTGITFSSDNQAQTEREVMPDFTLPEDISADSDQLPEVASLYTPSQSWFTLTGDNSWGFLQFEVFTGDEAYPIQNAVVIIKRRVNNRIVLLRVLFTDRNGKTSTVILPAPSAGYSQYPQSNGTRPFADYEVTVRARGYYSVTNITIPIFAGVKTVQPIEMIPLPQYSGSLIQPRTDTDNGMTNGSTVG